MGDVGARPVLKEYMFRILALALILLLVCFEHVSADGHVERKLGNKVHVLSSCEDIPLDDGAQLKGVVMIKNDIVCDETKVVEVTDSLLFVTTKPVVHIKGVQFHVWNEAALSLTMPKMVFERIEGVSTGIFTVEPRGRLMMLPRQSGTPSDNENEEDTPSLVRVEDGGVFQVDGRVDYTPSTMTVFLRPVTKDPTWIVNHRLRQRWHEGKKQKQESQQGRRQQQQQRQSEQDSSEPTLSKPTTTSTRTEERLVNSPFTPYVTSRYTFAQRLNLSPDRIKVGEELRFPSSMTHAPSGSVMSLGVEGSLVLSTQAAEDVGPRKSTTTPAKIVAAADFGKARVALFERASRSLSDGHVAVPGVKDDDGCAGRNAESLGGDEGTGADAAETKEPKEKVTGRRGWFGTARRRGRRDPPPPEDMSAESEAGVNERDRGGSSGSGDDGPLRYWGDDVALTITNTGSVVVKIGDEVVLEKKDPRKEAAVGWKGWMAKIRRNVNLARLAKAIILRRHHRRYGYGYGNGYGYGYGYGYGHGYGYGIGYDTYNTGDATGGEVISDEYSLHIVEKGIEVWLEGDFVWGSYVE